MNVQLQEASDINYLVRRDIVVLKLMHSISNRNIHYKGEHIISLVDVYSVTTTPKPLFLCKKADVAMRSAWIYSAKTSGH